MCNPDSSGGTVNWNGPRYEPAGSSSSLAGMGGYLDLAGQSFGALGSAGGQYFAKQGEKASYEAAARINEVNARIAELTAQSVLRAGMQAEQTQRLKTAQLKSSQKAAYAGNGIALDSSTVARVAASTDVLGEIDAATIKANAARTAWGYRTSGVNYTNQAAMDRVTADGIEPFRSGMSTLLTGATSVLGTRYKYQMAGILPKDDWFSRLGG